MFRHRRLEAPLLALFPAMGGAAGAAGAAGTAMTALQVASAGLSLAGAIQQARAGRSAAKAQQAQLNYQAGQETAAAIQEANARRRKADLMISRGLAVAAASGAGTSGLEGILSGIAEEGERSAGAAMYSGIERANGLKYQGAAGVSAANSQANSTILGALAKTGMSMYDLFRPSVAPTVPGSTGVYAAPSKEAPAGFSGWDEYNFVMGN